MISLVPAVQAGPPQSQKTAPSLRLELLGVSDAGNTGLNTDIWVHGGFAYTGTWGAGPFCPSDSGDPRVGVKVVDIRNPRNPEVAAFIDIPPGTRANDFKVLRANTPAFHGDVLIHSLERCRFEDFPSVRGGVALYDVTDARNPALLSIFDTGGGGVGVHNLFPFQRGHQAFVMLAAPFNNFADPEDPLMDGEPGDMRLLDISDPRQPIQVSKFNIFADRPDLVPAPDTDRGDPVVFIHDVWVNTRGTRALLSHWDAGLVVLDITVPESPAVLGVGRYWPAEEGNTHSAVFAQGDRLAIVGDEIFACPWGFARIFDLSDPTNPVQISTFAMPSVFDCPTDPEEFAEFEATHGFFTVHNPWVRGNLVFFSWYSQGIVVVDISDPANPQLVTVFSHEGSAGDFSHPFIPENLPMFWGVIVQRDLVVGSDINAGIFILRLRG